jgi:L-threonylcarbamoyladenylate synthase
MASKGNNNEIATKLTRSPQVAARFILQGEVVAFPTETVYGLAANIFDKAAIRKIFRAKGRPTDNPLIAHIADISQLELLTADIPPLAAKLIDGFFPGPLTLVLPKHPDVPALVTAGLPTIGVRKPLHKLALDFIRACGVPLVAPSANLSGRPSPTTWQAVAADLTGRISCILRGEQTEVGLESTVVDCTGAIPLVLRAGAITLEQLREVAPETALAGSSDLALPRSPGLKYRHYAPSAQVVLVATPQAAIATQDAAFIGLTAPPQAAAFALTQVCANVEDYAHALFQFFRECDAAGVQVIYCQTVKEEGLGLALMDRLRRAAYS